MKNNGKNRKKEIIKKEKHGITLIALVVTIIVLLILAGISISMLSGDNGILQRAADAKIKTDQAEKLEKKKLVIMSATSNLSGEIFEGVKIPAGLAPTRIEGESTIDEGLVVIDSEGNEYVWIEVPRSIFENSAYTVDLSADYEDENGNKKVTSSIDYEGIYKVLNKYAEDYRIASLKDE